MTTNKEFSRAIAAQLRGIIASKEISRTELIERTGLKDRTLTRYLNDPPQLTIENIKLMTDAVGADFMTVLNAAEQSLNDQTR